MIEKMNLTGAIVTYAIFISSILVFTFRLLERIDVSRIFGVVFLLMALPLLVMLITPAYLNRAKLYFVQISPMLASILVVFLLDYIFNVDFRQNNRMVIGFVMLFFAGTGGMIGVASLAGRSWMIAAIILYFCMAIFAFVQRSVTRY